MSGSPYTKMFDSNLSEPSTLTESSLQSDTPNNQKRCPYPFVELGSPDSTIPPATTRGMVLQTSTNITIDHLVPLPPPVHLTPEPTATPVMEEDNNYENQN